MTPPRGRSVTTWRKFYNSDLTPAIEAAREAGIAFTIHEYKGVDPGESDYAVAVAAELGIEPARLFKTLLASVNGKLQVYVIPADRRLDLRSVGK